MRTSAATSVETEPDQRSWLTFLAGCFVAICGVRIFLVQKYAASVAYGDDLDGIARRILLPWTHGRLPARALWAAHNGDHRILATRLWEMLWFAVNGSWDPKLVMIVKVPIFAAAATVFIHLLTKGFVRYRYLTAAVLAVLFAFPFAFSNLLWAFQSQFDFFLLSAALGWLVLVNGRTILALVISAASLLTLASGPLIAASYVPFFVVRWLEGKWHIKRTAAFSAGALLILALGVLSPTNEAKPHVGTPAEKAETLVRLYSWPFSNLLSIVERLPETEKYVPPALLRFPSPAHSWLLRAADLMHHAPWLPLGCNALAAMVVIAPILILLRSLVRGRVTLAAALGPLMLSGFAFLMLVATAVARADEITIAPRFLDHVALAGFASFAAGIAVVAREPSWRRKFVAWCVLMGVGYGATMVITMAQITRGRPAQSLTVLQHYFATTPHDHAAMLADGHFRQFIVSDDPTEFMAELDTPGLEKVMPLEVTAPTAQPGATARAAFATARYGWLIAAIGAFIAGFAVWRARQRPRLEPSPMPISPTTVSL